GALFANRLPAALILLSAFCRLALRTRCRSVPGCRIVDRESPRSSTVRLRIFAHPLHQAGATRCYCMIHDVSIPAALIAGLVSFLSPCVLPLVPPYLIYLTGATIEHVANDEPVSSSKRAVMISALAFVLGFSTVFIALGASASLIGGLIRAWSAELSIVAGIVIIIMGLHFLGLTRIGLLMREGRMTMPKPVGLWGAYAMGLAFAFGWTPCIGPILAAILSIAAAEATVTKAARSEER